MGMATFTEDQEQVRREFRNLHSIFQTLKNSFFPDDPSFCELSMGMSGDYKISIQHGMREEYLKGISDLGIRIEKVE